MGETSHHDLLRKYAHNQCALVVSDDSDLTGILSSVLSDFYKEVVVCDGLKSGSEIVNLRKVEGKKFSLIIADADLADMDAFKFVSTIKEKLPIVMISSNEGSDYFNEAISLGVSGYLFKPLQINQFVNTIAKVVIKCAIAHHKLSHLENNGLTNLPTAVSLDIYLERMDEHPVTLLKMRIDHFYKIREQVGIAHANRYVKEFAQMLILYFSHQVGIKIYHIASDEFGLIITENSHHVLSLAQNLLSAGKYFYTSDDGIIFNSTITIGVATGSGQTLLVHSDIALRHALNKLGSIVTYESLLKSDDETYIATHQALKLISDGIENDEITPYYQPIMDLASGKVYGYECLVRICHNGIIYTPDKFLDVAVDADQICAITRLMIRKSFEFFSREENRGYRFSLNVSSEDLKDETFIEYIGYWIDKFNLEPSRVSFEILENVNLYSSPSIKQRIGELKNMGCCISVDDFGTGYSNFLQLLALKPDFIKIDGSFVQRLLDEENFSTIFSKIVQLIHLCGAQCIAEYVSTPELIVLLKKLDVQFVQGYAIGMPSDKLL